MFRTLQCSRPSCERSDEERSVCLKSIAKKDLFRKRSLYWRDISKDVSSSNGRHVLTSRRHSFSSNHPHLVSALTQSPAQPGQRMSSDGQKALDLAILVRPSKQLRKDHLEIMPLGSDLKGIVSLMTSQFVADLRSLYKCRCIAVYQKSGLFTSPPPKILNKQLLFGRSTQLFVHFPFWTVAGHLLASSIHCGRGSK